MVLMAERPTAPTVVQRDTSIPDALRLWTPKSKLGLSVLKALPHLPHDLALELIERVSSASIMESELRLKVFRGLGLAQQGLIPWAEVRTEDHGLVSCRLVTDNGAGFLIDALQNLTEPENLKFHGIGTGTNAENATDSALQTELTTEYNPNSTRATGTNAEISQKVYQTVGTNTLDSGTPAITEHGVFSASSAGTLLDRSQFSAINLVGANGDGLQSDYRLTINSGG